MPKFIVTIRRDASVEYFSTPIEATTAAEAAKLAESAWKRDDPKGITFERDSSDLAEFDAINDIDPEWDVEELEGDE